MLLTWENREGTQLTSRGYAQAGGVDRAVQVSADTAYDSFTSSQQILARELLRGLTVVSRDGRFPVVLSAGPPWITDVPTLSGISSTWS